MGNPVARVPGSLGKPVGGSLSNIAETVISYLRGLNISMDAPAAPWSTKLPFLDSSGISEGLRDVYSSDNWAPSDDTETDNNVRDPPNARLPSARRERDATRPTKSVGVRLADPDWSTGQVSATVVIPLEAPLEYGSLIPPSRYATPVSMEREIRMSLTSTHLGATDLTLGGSARTYKVVHADWNLQLHLDPQQILAIVSDAVKQGKLGREQAEAMLSHVSLDLSSWVKAGPLFLSWVQLSASSLLPLRRPLLGALDRMLPVQIAAMPDSRLLMIGGMLLPGGVVFNTMVPGVGIDFSQYGRRQGGSVTVGGVTYPKLTELGSAGGPKVGRLFPIFGYVDLHYVRRISSTVDLGFRLTYAYSPNSGGSEPDPRDLKYLPNLRPADFRGTTYQPWQGANEENIAPDEATSRHRLNFRIEGTHDLLGGGPLKR